MTTAATGLATAAYQELAAAPHAELITPGDPARAAPARHPAGDSS